MTSTAEPAGTPDRAAPAPAPGPVWATALVTGASSGIGRAMARQLAAEGTALVVVARDEARLRALADEVAVDVEVLVADLADPAQLARVEARVADAAHPVDLVVNNAGFGTYGPLAALDVADETREIAVNVTAVPCSTSGRWPGSRRPPATPPTAPARRSSPASASRWPVSWPARG